ncbi:hypothetical protein CWE03_04890 [Lactobacillus johnsonii]|uniref:ImmA/IrrE family metallo-endopeptidase n=1 Tax=Lactobacillus johnsonii TaxID=33959 RepID=A0AAW5LXP1_LACJH|nr:ImmA/IrrE family metallo-endopeptidase [Lactobacillus johnsonii]PJN78812.1 hypothetical protein CWE03_04890 [Lactobacillus johnsonii]
MGVLVTAKFKVNNKILKWVLQIADDKLGVDWIDKIKVWMKGEKTPTIHQLQVLSKKSQIPFGNFFLSDPPVEEIPLLKFRTINNDEVTKVSSELLKMIDSMEMRSDWLEDYRIREGYSPILFVGMGKHKSQQSSEEIAKQILKFFNLKEDWNIQLKSNQNAFNYLRTIITSHGIVVETSSFVGNNTRDGLNINEFRAFVLIKRYAPLIFINTKDSKNARLFSLVHELVHLWYGKTELFNYNFQTDPKYLNKKFEQRVNKIAESIIFNKKYFIRYWDSIRNSDFEKIYKIAKKFKASPMATAITAKNYKLISQELVNEINKETSQFIVKSSHTGGPNFYDTLAYKLDHNFASAVINSTDQGDTTYLDAFNLLNVKNMHAYNELKARVEEKNK